MLQVEIIGNLGQDAEVKEFNGQKYIAFSVAHTESFTDQRGQKQKRTTWVSCLRYGESGVISYLKKGTSVFVRGDLSAKAYNAAGTTQVGINCRVRELQLLSGNKREQEAEQSSSAPVPAQASAAPSYTPQASHYVQQPGNFGDDDLPF